LYCVLPALVGAFLIMPVFANAASETEGPRRGHKTISGIVTKKAGILAVKSPDGATY
jgi:hypothetical protein